MSRDVDIVPFRPLDLTPWRPRPRETLEVETVSMTRVSVTRARRVEGGRGDAGYGRAADVEHEFTSHEPSRSERRGDAADGYLEAAPKVVAEKVVEADARFEHQAMTPLPTEGFLSLWANRSMASEPPPRRAAAAFRAYDRMS
jgi:hypothetical protein